MHTFKWDRNQQLAACKNPQPAGEASTLRLVEQPPRWVPTLVDLSGPVVDEPSTQSVAIQAEVRTKRFGAWRVDEDRYTATVEAGDGSPSAVIAALAGACAAIPEFNRPRAGGEHLILQIRLSTGA